MASNYTIHAGTYFDARLKSFNENVSITVNPANGSIVHIEKRAARDIELQTGDIDLRDKIVLPGLVDAHTHIFLHSYK